MKKKFVCLVFLLFCVSFARAPFSNPAFFGGNDNQVSIFWGAGVRHKSEFENLHTFGVNYSQPNEFFRLCGRRNAELIWKRGAGDLSHHDNFMLGLSQDMMTPAIWRFYVGAMLGIYIRSDSTNRISSLFTFGQKGFLGFIVNEHVTLEIYARHFSNGTLTTTNSGYDFVGLSANWNFGRAREREK